MRAARRTSTTTPKELCLKEICFQAVSRHHAALGSEAVLDLPTPLIKDLLPHLTVCQLDELQPNLNQRGISTLSEWIGVLQDICGPNHVIDFHTEEEAKNEVMRNLFTLVFYGFSNSFVNRNITNLNTPSFLWAAAKCIKQFFLTMPVESLITERRPLLNLLEKRIVSVTVTQRIDPSKRTALYVLHRLLDHGVAKKLVVHAQCPKMLSWILHGRGSQYENPELKKLLHSKKASCISETFSAVGAGCSSDLDDEVTPCKRSKLDSVSVEEEASGKANSTVDPQVLCQTFTPCDGPSAGACPSGQIESLEIRQCRPNSFSVLTAALPTFFCLRSLTLHSFSILLDKMVLRLARALKQLSESSCSSLTELSISVLPYIRLMEVLLDASPNVTSLHVDIETVTWGPLFSPHHLRTAESDDMSEKKAELPLEKLVVKVAELQTDLSYVTSVLTRSPRLTSLHLAGMRLPTGSSQSQLLTTLSESNALLRSLTLEDMQLSDCLPEILNLLRDCKLEELRLNDCRLLEKWSDKEESLQQLVAALKTLPSLHTLSLSQNRLVKNVCVLAELFSGSSPSSVKRLDISSNFIQPADLMEFAERLRTHHPPHRLTLDLRKNPGDRDPDTWNAALKRLRPFCVLLIEGWNSTDTMADHISNM
ncbi:leucine-rich repeat-containing protein 41 isoform X1 [Sebastes umbrosus]|uniref:leucine-rich repeat-containing protein 41 isoform X1 n=1 Tax=Sebastes umbrosus TaxID=72105 RepID=UPI0018A06F7D|nr:leucine-rich repeat-containing protein 41 isoform X1 [Sebastes umbrosus]